MSERHGGETPTTTEPRWRDSGISLPEVLIGVLLTSMLIIALTSAVMVMVSQQDNTDGRLNNARSEQSVGLWMPADLASAESVDRSPGASPCGTSCPSTANTGGSNALMLSWSSRTAGESAAVATTTSVSYRYVAAGSEYQLVRVECTRVGTGAYTCSTATVLHNLPAPPDGVTWQPGVTSPQWVIQVSEPLDPSDPGTTGSTVAPESGVLVKNAQRVVVTINGGGDAPGQGGGTNQITLSAGGTDLTTIEATSVAGTPSFTAARSRCGGSIALVIDESTSIGSTAMTQVEDAVVDFVETFAGTPVKLQVISFATTSDSVGTADWSHYFDMLDDAQVTTLLNAIRPELSSNGYTNWEDALFRTFYNSDGTVQATLPDLVLFFTDGVPTRSRVTQSSSAAPITPPARLVGYPAETTTSYNQESFYRANVIAQEFRSSVRFIGVGVGPDVDPGDPGNVSSWISGVTGWHYVYERAFHYEKKSGASWVVTDLAGYNAQSPSNRRIRYSSPWNEWEVTDKSGYDSASSSGRRRTKTYAEPFDYYDQTTASTANATIITRLITGTDNAVNGLSSGGVYTNADEANMYVLPDWAQFSGALQAVALAECGATLTMQTKVGGAAAADPFTYQNTAITSSGGAAVATDLSVVTTTRQFTSGTFDFDIPDGSYVTVEIQPQNLSDLTAYQPAGWSCRAGPNTKSFETVAIPGSSWTGIRVQVRANEAVSCIQNVTRI